MLDKVLLTIGVFLGLFIIAMVVLFCIYQSVPDTLIQCVLGSSAIELLLMAWITVTKKKLGVDDADEDNDGMC